MQDGYQIPALVLTTLLLPAYGHLYLRSRDTRTLLWFLAFLFSVTRMFLLYPLGASSLAPHPWATAAGQALALLSSALFLGSLSPLRFRAGRVRILYVIPFIGPLLVYAVVASAVCHEIAPEGRLHLLFPALCLTSTVAGLFWARAAGGVRAIVGASACLVFGGVALGLSFASALHPPLDVVEAGNHLITALLVLVTFRRISSGIALTVVGFTLWSMPVLFLVPALSGVPVLALTLVRVIVMAKVVTALGLILLVLENELQANKATGDRERRARKEMEAYTSLVLTRRRLEDFDRQADEVCQTIVENSRFAQAALLLLQPAGAYALAGASGVGHATRKAIDSMAARLPVGGFLAPASARPAVANSHTLHLDLEPWLIPGDDLTRLRFTSALAVPMYGREGVEGALLLAEMRMDQHGDALRLEDLLPIEMLAGRLQAVRSQTIMLEKLIDSEKFAVLGQLSGNVTQQLNNPLTVILGYASLLEESTHLEDQERRGIEAILSEARHMRSTLQSLSRVARSSDGSRVAISVAELLGDMEHLHRSEFLQRSIEFRLNIAPSIPRVRCHAQQLRQAVLHCLQFAMESVENLDAVCDRTVRLEASAEGDRVQIMVAHSGPGFHRPEKAFDPFDAPQAGATEVAGLGLSLCASILRDNDGHASAVNLDPQGAAILLELQTA